MLAGLILDLRTGWFPRDYVGVHIDCTSVKSSGRFLCINEHKLAPLAPNLNRQIHHIPDQLSSVSAKVITDPTAVLDAGEYSVLCTGILWTGTVSVPWNGVFPPWGHRAGRADSHLLSRRAVWAALPWLGTSCFVCLQTDSASQKRSEQNPALGFHVLHQPRRHPLPVAAL